MRWYEYVPGWAEPKGSSYGTPSRPITLSYEPHQYFISADRGRLTVNLIGRMAPGLTTQTLWRFANRAA